MTRWNTADQLIGDSDDPSRVCQKCDQARLYIADGDWHCPDCGRLFPVATEDKQAVPRVTDGGER